MKGFIKIGLIALAAIIVGVLIFVFIGVIATPPPSNITPKDFTATVENRIRQEITGKPFSETRTAFDDLNGYIATEAFVTLSSGEKALSESEAQHCRQLVFDAYAPIFVEHGNSYFQRSSWSENDITIISTEAQRLTDLNLAEEPDIRSSLSNFIQYTKDYTEAKKIIRGASSVKSVSSAQSYISKAKNLNKAPLSNNTELKQGLEGVASAAKNGLARYLQNKADDLLDRAYNNAHPNYVETQAQWNNWYDEYIKTRDEIVAYRNAFGSNNTLEQAKNDLSAAEEAVSERLTGSTINY